MKESVDGVGGRKKEECNKNQLRGGRWSHPQTEEAEGGRRQRNRGKMVEDFPLGDCHPLAWWRMQAGAGRVKAASY